MLEIIFGIVGLTAFFVLGMGLSVVLQVLSRIERRIKKLESVQTSRLHQIKTALLQRSYQEFWIN